MAVDTSIPLSYKPIEVENPLNRMAVVQGVQANAMKIQEMQRAQEEQNQLRALFSSGADLSSPDVVKQAMQISPELGMKIRAAQLQEREQQTKLTSEKMKLSREMLNNVRTPEEYQADHINGDANIPLQSLKPEELAAKYGKDAGNDDDCVKSYYDTADAQRKKGRAE